MTPGVRAARAARHSGAMQLDVVTADLGRMITAMRSRGVDPRSPRHWPALARTLGALFVRSYERGERVHLAMLSRGYETK